MTITHLVLIPAVGKKATDDASSWWRMPRQQHAILSIMWIFRLLVLVDFIGTSAAQLDPVKNFCRRFGHQTTVIDRRLYVDGGLINYNPIAQYPANYSSELISD